MNGPMHRSNSKCYLTISSAQSSSEDGTVRSSALADCFKL